MTPARTQVCPDSRLTQYASSNANREEQKALLIQEDYLKLQARCVREFGPAGGIYIRQCVFWSGKSKLEDGWFYKNREEMRQETGLSVRQQEKARKVLTAKGVLEEKRPSRRKPTHYRVNLLRLAQILGLVESPATTDTTQIADGSDPESPGISDVTQSPGYTDMTEWPDITGCAEWSANSGLLHRVHQSDNLITSTNLESALQAGAGGLKRRPAPQQMVENGQGKEEKEPANGSNWREFFGAQDLQDVWLMLENEATDPGMAYARYLQGRLSLKDVARAVCLARTQGEEETEKYIVLVRYVDGHLCPEKLARDAVREEDEGLVLEGSA